jgi:hypothetical protein
LQQSVIAEDGRRLAFGALCDGHERPSAHVSIEFRVLWDGYCEGVDP